MSPIRLIAAGLAAVSIAAPAMAQQACLSPSERVAFDVRALQSQMMVAMLQCGQEQQTAYGQFTTRYDAQLKEAFRGLQSHYRRVAGARGERAVDTYVTQLANVQSGDASRQGSNFCRNMAPVFAQALAAPNSVAALAALSQQQNINTVHGRPECSGAVPSAAPERSTRTRMRSADAGTAVRQVSTQVR
ncbi:hypothetical protein [Muricoccus radiodurans]|uniref:hypothetical protein n=1 Tax=Muricoccus radiodurans TaxID=2231721 RepID=UPI003CF3ECEC